MTVSQKQQLLIGVNFQKKIKPHYFYFPLYLRITGRYPLPLKFKAVLAKQAIFINLNDMMEKWPRGRRRSPAKGVYGLSRIEGSNPSFSAIILSVMPRYPLND